MTSELKSCRFCKSDNVYVQQHSGLWKAKCNDNFCLVVQCCDTERQAIDRWNELNGHISDDMVERRLKKTLEYFDNKVYILERAPNDELSDRYRYEVTKLRREIEDAKAALTAALKGE